MISSIGSVLEYLDLSGRPVNLLYKKSESVQTALGGITSIIKFFFIIFILYTYVVPFWKREKKEYFTYSINENREINYKIENDTLLGFSLFYKNNTISDNFKPSDYFYFTASFIKEENFFTTIESKKFKLNTYI
jgi:hypothetical protein